MAQKVKKQKPVKPPTLLNRQLTLSRGFLRSCNELSNCNVCTFRPPTFTVVSIHVRPSVSISVTCEYKQNERETVRKNEKKGVSVRNSTCDENTSAFAFSP
jgi:hypothetical protein